MIELFRLLIERPIFNLLEIIYAVIPGHDLGVAIIIFTALIRLLLWPLVKKQLHHTKQMRALAPELKKIKKSAGGDRQKEARLQMEFYKEKGIKPFGTIGTVIVQIPIFLGLYRAVYLLIKDPNTLQTFSYDWVRNLSWIKHLASNSHDFSYHFLGFVDLSQKGLKAGGGMYLAAIILAIVAAIAQYYQSKSLMIDEKDSRKLKDIFKAAASGEQADQAEMTAAVSKGMLIFMPFMTFIFSISIPSALSLYVVTSSVVGYFQQRSVLKEDVEDMAKISRDQPIDDIPEAEIIEESPKKPKTKKSAKSKKKRRR